ncbi:hypothetical protein [Vibrio navarrensis]|uniref:hypothetical protein n=1 Tax=Vibrio navarrensis TaxID=29495 RepID=UPI00051D9723|nr:hypothetical protein [Vibrio navarrensis]KGK15337.1 hypothetical protein EA24_08115 [Vibrio navarrensis]
MSLDQQAESREYSVFLEKFADGSVYYAAKKKWPESATESLAWAKSQKRQRPLVEKYLQFEGQAEIRQQLVSGLAKVEAEIIKSNLIERSKEQGKNTLNIIKKSNVVLESGNVAAVQRSCKCGYNRAVELVEIFNSIK